MSVVENEADTELRLKIEYLAKQDRVKKKLNYEVLRQGKIGE